MSTLAELEQAIEALPPHDVEAQASGSPINEWLERARGTAAPVVTTEAMLGVTRGE